VVTKLQYGIKTFLQTYAEQRCLTIICTVC